MVVHKEAVGCEDWNADGEQSSLSKILRRGTKDTLAANTLYLGKGYFGG